MSYQKSVVGIGITIGLLLTGLLLTVSSAAFAQTAARTDARTDAMLNNGPPIWDANHDGVYTCQEWKSFMDQLFKSGDRNHDGSLNRAEFDAVKKGDPSLADADFGYFDENQDGKISRSEFVDKPSVFIMRFDKNGDCRVTQDEIKAGSTPAQVGPKQPTRDRFHTN